MINQNEHTRLGVPIPSGWKKMQLNDLFEEVKFLSSNVETYPLYSFTIENGVCPKPERYNREHLLKDKNENEYRIIYKNQFIFNPMNLRFGAFGRSKIEFPVAVSAYYNILKPKIKGTEDYLEYYLKSERLLNLYNRISIGSLEEKKRVHLSMFLELEIPLPSEKEYTKIGAILETWDTAIRESQLLLDELNRRRKGLMQQLLFGKKRLKGYSEDWKIQSIGEIAQHYSMKNKNNEDLIVLSCTKHDGLVPSLEYFGRKVYGDDTSKYKVVPKGYFAYATNHIEEGSIGLQTEYDAGLVSPMYTVFKTSNKVDDSFLFRLLKTDRMIFKYQSNMSGSIARRGGLRWGDFKDIKLILPSIDEQQAISKVFDHIEQEIRSNEIQLNCLIAQKKALMQQLLTGQKRVKV